MCVHRNDHELFVARLCVYIETIMSCLLHDCRVMSWLCRSHVYRCHEQSLCVSVYLV